jgi:hypothetical protein
MLTARGTAITIPTIGRRAALGLLAAGALLTAAAEDRLMVNTLDGQDRIRLGARLDGGARPGPGDRRTGAIHDLDRHDRFDGSVRVRAPSL